MESIEIKRNKFSFVTDRHMNIQKSLMSSLLKSKARISLKFDNTSDESTIGKSIISSAEDNLRSQINLQPFMSNPKLTSSTITLLKQEEQDTKSITFNVDFASTPKKIIQRSSTPKTLKSNKLVKSKQFKSSVVKQAKLLSKILPPPLLTSSFQSQRKEKKRKNCSTNCKCVQVKQSKRAKLAVNAVTSTPSFKRLKYPIKYLNLKTKDIDRLGFNFEQNTNEFHCCHYQSEFNYLQPNVTDQSSNCYLYGDYKMWII